MNRPGMKGFRVKTPKKKTKQDEDDVCFPTEIPLNGPNLTIQDMDDAEPESPTKGKARSKKRTKQEVEHEDEEPPKPRKLRGKANRQPEEDEESEAPPPKKQRGKVAKASKKDEVEPAAEVPAKSKAKSKKGSKAQAEADANEGYTSIFGPQNPSADGDAEGEAKKPKTTKGSKKKVNTPAEPSAEEPAKGKRGAKKKTS